MTYKQMKKFARELYECELIHSDVQTSNQEKAKAEQRIMAITNQIMAIGKQSGLTLLLEINAMVEELFNKETN